MKIRSSFISNSSSSSFVLYKKPLTEDQIKELREFFKKHEGCGETDIREHCDFFCGDIEAHNPMESLDEDETLHTLLIDMINKMEIENKYFCIEYSRDVYEIEKFLRKQQQI